MLDKFAAREKILEILHSGSEESVIQAKLKEVLAKTNELYIVECGITNSNLRLLASALKNNNTIHSINLSSNNIGKGVKELFDILQVNNSICDINLSYNGIREDIENLAKMLEINNTIQTLDLSGNKIGERIKYLSEMLQVNNSVRNINIAFSEIGKNMTYLTNVLRKNNTVHILDLYDSSMPIEIKDLRDILECNNGLRTLKVQVQNLDVNKWRESDIKIWKKIKNSIQFFNITITHLEANMIEHKECKPYFIQNKEIAPKILDLVKKNTALLTPLYDDVVKTIKARSMSEYYCNFFQYMGICNNIYQDNSNAEISSCPPEILYKIAEIYTEPKFQSKYDITPTVCRVTVEVVLKEMEEELAEASAVSR